MRHLLLLCFLGLLISGDTFATRAFAEPVFALRIATLAPRQSPLGRAYQDLRKEMKARTEGKVELKMYYGGISGDEKAVVNKMRVGQLDGALLTATGLGGLVPQVLVLQAPGLIRSYETLDRVRNELAPELEALFVKAGYRLIGWGDSGQIRLFSKHRIQDPSDLKRVRPWVWRDSPTMKAFISAVGANGVQLGVPEVYSALQTGMIDTVISSSIGVLGFQWHTRLKTMSKQASGVVVGAFIIKKDRFDAMPQAARDLLLEATEERRNEWRESGRQVDAEAAALLSKRLEVVNMWRHMRSWEVVQAAARDSLAGRLYSRALLDRVMEIAQRPTRRGD